MAEIKLPTYLRFADLRERGIVSNWPTLTRWIRTIGFPPGIQLGPNRRVWIAADIAEWLESRPEYRPRSQHLDEEEDR